MLGLRCCPERLWKSYVTAIKCAPPVLSSRQNFRKKNGCCKKIGLAFVNNVILYFEAAYRELKLFVEVL